jgi:hypothetical protein
MIFIPVEGRSPVMYTEYVKETNEDAFLYEPVERTSDIQLPMVMNYILIAAWGIFCLIGFAIMFLAKMPLIGATIIGVPTFCLMIIKPSFALCAMMLILPTGAGIAAGGMFSLDRGVAIAVVISFMFNLMLSRPSLRVRNKALWVLVGYTVWVFLISFTSPYLVDEMAVTLTAIQLMIFSFIVYWIIETNSIRTFLWVLRSYIVGSLGVITLTYITGAAMEFTKGEEGVESGGRYVATLGQGIDANFLAVLIGLAFLSAIYLMAADKNFFFKIIYIIAIAFLPIMMIRTGSRGGLIAMFVTIVSPFLFLKQVLKKPALLIVLFLAIIIGSLAVWFLLTRGSLETALAERLTRSEDIQSSFDYRKELIVYAIKSSITRPMGTTRYGWMLLYNHVPHNDFFYNLGIYGIPGAGLFALYLIMIILTVKRMPLGFEKFYSRAIVTFLLVSGLSVGQLATKHYWIFMVIVITSERIARLKSQTHSIAESNINE